MRKNYIQPEIVVEAFELSSQVLSGSVLGIGTTGGTQSGARAPGRIRP